MPIRPISVTFFFTIYSSYKYVQSNQSNTGGHKKKLATSANFFPSMLFFLRTPVSWSTKQRVNYHHHFAPEMCFLLFLEPSRGSPHPGVSWFLQPSRHLLQSCATNLCKPLAVMSHSSTSFHLFFGLPFFVPLTSKSSIFTGSLSSSILSTCPNHLHLFSLRNSSNLTTPVISRIFSLFILSFKVFFNAQHMIYFFCI